MSLSGVGTGVGAASGLGVEIGINGDAVCGFGAAAVGSGSVFSCGAGALVGEGAAVSVGVDGVGVLGAGGFRNGVAPGSLTVVGDPSGADTSGVVSTVPEIVTTVVSPFGETATYESDPARITDAMPALRTS